MSQHANHQSIDSKECVNDSRYLELEAQVETQSITIRTLKSLLEQHRHENEKLLSRATMDNASSVCSGLDSKENTDRMNGSRLVDFERKAKQLETNNLKLALEIERLTREKGIADSTIAALKTKIRIASKEKENVECKLSEAERSIGSLSEIKHTTERRLSETIRELTELTTQVSRLERQLSISVPQQKLDESISCLRLELEGTVVSREMAVQQANALATELQDVKTEAETVRKTIGAYELTVRQLRSSLVEAADSVSIKSRQLESLDHEIVHLRKAHRDDLRSLESSHTLTVTLLEQTTATALEQLESQVRLSSDAARLTQERLVAVTQENTDLKSEILKSKLISLKTANSESQTAVVFRAQGIVTDSLLTSGKSSNTDHVYTISQFMAEIKKHITCNACSRGAVGILFPCGHGVCEECFNTACIADDDMRGITCAECKNSLPVTKISRSKHIADIYSLSRQFCS